MKTVKKITELQNYISAMKNENKTIGFVPTMGALHEGHLSLIREAKKDCNVCVVSIFVNPNQFNNPEDLEKYPRNLTHDAQLLQNEGVGIIFTPSVEEVYPEQDNRLFDFGQLDKVMEGEHRPGHFNGVAQVVSRLFDMVSPDKAYFGEKDFQQLAIVREMVRQLSLAVQIVPVPIVREKSGLAMSSRNERLTEAEKRQATNIYKILKESAQKGFERKTVEEIKKTVAKAINSLDGLSVEYFDIVDGHNLQTINNWNDSPYIVGCIAVFCGEVRLIDNIVYKD